MKPYDEAFGEVTGAAGTVRLSALRSRIFSLLWRARGRPISRDFVMGELYDDRDGDPPADRGLDVAIHRLRRDLARAGFPWKIDTVRCRGWALLKVVDQEGIEPSTVRVESARSAV